jgi:hypothetical protein
MIPTCGIGVVAMPRIITVAWPLLQAKPDRSADLVRFD